MKQITISRVGSNHPGGANWTYCIWLVSFIDTNQPYCMGHTVKETFGGDSRFKHLLETQTKHKVIEVNGVYTSTGTPKITGVSKMLDIESQDFIDECVEFLNK